MELEQVHVKVMKRRSLRLKWMAGLGMALAITMSAVVAAKAFAASSVSTQTSLNVVTRDQQGGQSRASIEVTVTGADGLPASGVVNIEDAGHQLAELALNASGQANTVLNLPAGSHSLRADYVGDGTHLASTSTPYAVDASGGTTPNFQVSLAPVPPATLPMALTAGESGMVQVTVSPINNAVLTSPMFLTLSCSGLPAQSFCSFSPSTLEILRTTPTSCAAGSPPSACPPTSLMTLQTQRQGTSAPPVKNSRRNSTMWEFLLPGALGLGGLGWGTRRRRWLQRFFILALLGLVTTLGTTACNPLYYYRNNGPPITPPTPAGKYTITVTAQSTNGVTAITNSTTMVATISN